MKNSGMLLLAGGLLACAPVLADSTNGTTMKFTSSPVAEKVAASEHKIYPYRTEDRVIVVVVDPIACGQKPVNPSFVIKGNVIRLHYDLTPVPASVSGQNCTAHSTFDMNNVPHADLSVEFAGGDEPYRSAQMTRCPKVEPTVDVWDCMIPLR